MSQKPLLRISRRISEHVEALSFGPPVTHVYNPLNYARLPHEEYLSRYGIRGCRTLLVGMNPGPWGMAQTGVPFGAVAPVRDWLGIERPVRTPEGLHPKRPVLGFACTRQEVSGQRVWGWARERFVEARIFARAFFIWNYCPLVFFDAAGRNITPDKLRAADRKRLFEVCDRGLREFAEHLQPRHIVGIGKFAESRVREALPEFQGNVGGILHPSPASPAANRGWAKQAEAQLRKLGAQ